MGRPTLASQIAKAAAEGDMAKVQELAAKLNGVTPKKAKPKPKPKTKVKSKSEAQVSEPDFSEFISKAKDPNKPPKYIDEDGNEKVRARIIPFETKTHKNSWSDNLSESTELIPKKTKKQTKVVKKDYREAVEKVKIECVRCHEKKLVWPGEVMHKNWSCDECLTSNNRSNRD